MAYDSLGLYFLLRVFIRDADDTLILCKIAIIALIPIAVEMLTETVTGRDVFAFLGGVPEMSEVRGGHVRAQGPFGHSILAGTVGAVCLPLAILFWEKNRNLAFTGLIASWNHCHHQQIQRTNHDCGVCDIWFWTLENKDAHAADSMELGGCHDYA